MSDKLNFLKGSSSNLPSIASEKNSFYLTEDTYRLYFSDENKKLHELNIPIWDESGNKFQQVYCSTIPYGTAIAENKDLNTTEFLKVGNYYCSKNTTVESLTNCPTRLAFMMQVYSPLSTTINNETTKTWVYRLRKIITHKGQEYFQYINSKSTAGVFTYGPWVKMIDKNDIPSEIDNHLTKASVTTYGAKGDGSTDDTLIFQNALANNRVVYVPEGTYILSDTIVVQPNCELELSQAAHLKFTQTKGNCIELRSSATLRGNHAIIEVPYGFGSALEDNEYANVISIDTQFDESTDVPPYDRWDPQWKRGRYIYDINIIKPTSGSNAGFHYSLYGECSGTAIYLSAKRKDLTNGEISYIWGATLQGIRIAGAFSYGINAENIGTLKNEQAYGDDAWNHDMRIEAVIQGCEVGANLFNCNSAHLAITVQPSTSLLPKNNGKFYAKWGIRLEDSKGVNMSQSRVWDWQNWEDNEGKYRSIGMFGNCSGADITDYCAEYSKHFWESIYYDNPASMFGAVVRGPKGNMPVDSKYAFYKNFTMYGYEFNKQNVSGKDYQNTIRYDVPINIYNGYVEENYNMLYKIGYFIMNGSCENVITNDSNVITFDDPLNAETITIEENDEFGIAGWSNLHYESSSMKHYWNPLPSNYDKRIPIYFYTKEEIGTNDFNGGVETKITIYRLVRDHYDMQHIYNCKISITNARRFIFEGFTNVGVITNLDTDNIYKKIETKMLTDGVPKLAGQLSVINNEPIVCLKNAEWDNTGINITTNPTLGYLLTTTSKINAHNLIGENTITTPNNINEVSIGKYNTTNNNLLFSIGNGTSDTARTNVFSVGKNGSIAEGTMTIASGASSHAEGHTSKATGEYAHAEGYKTIASGSAAHAEGYTTEATGNYSHSEGYDTLASGIQSHAQGYKTIALGQRSNAEGSRTMAVGFASHAEGFSLEQDATITADMTDTDIINKWNAATYKFTATQGYGAHAEGYSTLALNDGAHAEGQETIAQGKRAHAEGKWTRALAEESHAGGLGTIADQAYQTAIGSYNESTSALFVIGNGINDTTRSNVFEVFNDGRVVANKFIGVAEKLAIHDFIPAT